MHNFLFFLFVLLAYGLGSIPFGWLIGMVFYKTDIRKSGSKNIGATNVWRLLGPVPAVATLLLDAGKGFIFIFLVREFLRYPPLQFSLHEQFIFGITLVLGHCYSYLLGGKGGKGVATAYGVLWAMQPFVALVTCGIWLLSFLVTRISSLSALLSWFFVPILFYYFHSSYAVALLSFWLSLLIFWRHRANIISLIEGTEQPITYKNKMNLLKSKHQHNNKK